MPIVRKAPHRHSVPIASATQVNPPPRPAAPLPTTQSPSPGATRAAAAVPRAAAVARGPTTSIRSAAPTPRSTPFLEYYMDGKGHNNLFVEDSTAAPTTGAATTAAATKTSPPPAPTSKTSPAPAPACRVAFASAVSPASGSVMGPPASKAVDALLIQFDVMKVTAPTGQEAHRKVPTVRKVKLIYGKKKSDDNETIEAIPQMPPSGDRFSPIKPEPESIGDETPSPSPPATRRYTVKELL